MSTTSTSLQHHVHTAPNINNQNINSNINNNGIKSEYGEGLAPPPSLGNHPGAAELSSGSSSPSPELVLSGVPNPFARSSSSPLPNYVCSSSSRTTGMNSVNWASHQGQNMVAGSVVGQDQLHPQPILSAPMPVPNPFQPISHAHTNAPSPASAPSGIRLPGHSSSMPNGAGLGMTMSSPQPMPPYSHDNGNNENTKPGDGSADNSPETTTKGGLNNRRQKRLERNRESARLSRRRRKQYLEVLEERVKNLSVEMDKGRRQHVTESVNTLLQMKRQALADPSANLTNVENVSTCLELRVAATFLTQQLSSLSVPPHIKFLLWLSMQNDSFFRGGRASSERLSAARIGERMLSSGNDRVPPAHGMWPLFCNEVGLSYDQEERVRAFQKSLLLSSEGWLQRHSASSSTLLMQSNHDAVQALAHTIGQRQKSIVHDNLTADQKRKFLSWADQNAARIAMSSKGTESTAPVDGTDGYKLSEEHHDSANMYILNHRFQNVANSLAKPDMLVNKATLRRFARRPSFESLGSCMAMERKEEEGLSRECSFASTGSLKRSASELSVADEERAQIHCIPPEEAEATVKPAIEAALGFVKHLIPVPPTPPTMISAAVQPGFSMPPPPPKPNHQFVPAPSVAQQHVQCPMPAPVEHNVQPMYSSTMMPPHYSPHQAISQPAPAPEYQHQQHHHGQQQEQQQFQGQPVYAGQSAQYPIMPTFLPPHLNVVPEDGFLPSGNGAEDFLFELAEEDWAIGEGFDDVNLLP